MKVIKRKGDKLYVNWKDELVKKINGIDTSGLNTKHDYDNNTGETDFKIPSITGLATTTDLTAVKNTLTDFITFVEKADYDDKIKLRINFSPRLIMKNLRVK